MKSFLRAIRPVVWSLSFVLSCGSSAAFAESFEVTSAANFTSGIKLEQPMDINLDVGGVKLVSVFFDPEKGQAFAILQNRTPASTTPTLAIALMDAKGKLVATGIDVSDFSFSGDKNGPGEQKNVVLSFDKFINDFKNIASFQVVLSIGKTKEVQGKAATVPNFGG